MKVWTNNQFEGHWPVGTAAVVRADTAEQAAYLLNEAIAKLGLRATARPEDMLRFPEAAGSVAILRDGDY